MGAGSPQCPQVLWTDSLASQIQCEGSRIILHCSPALDAAFGEGAVKLGGFVPPHSIGLDLGREASGTPC